MGILNVTPDSFSDGGLLADAGSAVAAGCRMADLGVALVDVGGESTRPRGLRYGAGGAEVPLEEELSRVFPVIEGLRRERPALPISVDTRKAEVALAALAAGADVVNVVTGLDVSAELLALVAERRAPIVLGHCRGTPATTFQVSRFLDVVADVAADLAAARERAIGAGAANERVFLDPGLGFGKDTAQNYALLGSLDRLAPPGAPIVVGASRKAFLGAVSGVPARERLPESLAAVAVALRSAPGRPLFLRVHDVAETLRFLAVLERAV